MSNRGMQPLYQGTGWGAVLGETDRPAANTAGKLCVRARFIMGEAVLFFYTHGLGG
jgi:hypothetical protein